VEKRALKKSINIVGIIVSTRCWIHATVSKIDRSIAPGSRCSKLHLNLQLSSSSSSEFQKILKGKRNKKKTNKQTNKQALEMVFVWGLQNRILILLLFANSVSVGTSKQI
jgi:hypothetical protein